MNLRKYKIQLPDRGRRRAGRYGRLEEETDKCQHSHAGQFRAYAGTWNNMQAKQIVGCKFCYAAACLSRRKRLELNADDKCHLFVSWLQGKFR